MTPDAPPKLDFAVSLLLIVLAALIYWQASLLPPGMFEPLGPAPVPLAVSAAVMALALVTALRAVLLYRRGSEPAPEAEFQPRWRDTAIVAVLTMGYVMALTWRITSYAVATTVFLTLAITVLGRFQRRSLPWALLIAVILGFGCQYVFTRVFVVDLP